MNVSKKIKTILSEEEISLTELANRLDISVNNLSNKLKRDNFKTEEIELIAEKLGYSVDVKFNRKRNKMLEDYPNNIPCNLLGDDYEFGRNVGLLSQEYKYGTDSTQELLQLIFKYIDCAIDKKQSKED